MSPNILLLDPDPARLDALRPLAQDQAAAWNVTPVATAAATLGEFERQPPDVAIIDLAVVHPHHDDFLNTLRSRWPDTSLIAITPTGTNMAGPLLAPAAHQYIGADTATQEIGFLVKRSLDLRELMSQPALRSLIGGVRLLPARPRIFVRLQTLLRHESLTTRKVAALLEEDAALAVKVLQLANTVLFRNSDRVKNIEQAVMLLGYSRLSALVLNAEAMAGWHRVSGHDPDLAAMQAHDQQVARVTAALMNGHPGGEEAVLAALLHDIGYWVLAQEFPDALRRAAAAARSEDVPMYEAERQVLGTCHAHIGAYLLGLWGLPFTVVEAVACHHAPEQALSPKFSPLAALAVAMALAGTDDSDAFRQPPRRSAVVSPDFIEQFKDCPFVWSDAARTAAACLSPEVDLRA